MNAILAQLKFDSNAQYGNSGRWLVSESIWKAYNKLNTKLRENVKGLLWQ